MESFRPQGPARIIWRYGIVFSAMFLVYAFANIGLAILDSDYSGIGAPLIYGAYAVVHLVVNKRLQGDASLGLAGTDRYLRPLDGDCGDQVFHH